MSAIVMIATTAKMAECMTTNKYCSEIVLDLPRGYRGRPSGGAGRDDHGGRRRGGASKAAWGAPAPTAGRSSGRPAARARLW